MASCTWRLRRATHIESELFAPVVRHDREETIFEEPLRAGVRVARGSDLVHETTLRQLLTWFSRDRPDLAVVLVDRDGEQTRYTRLIEATSHLLATRVIGVAVEEFESWLIGDPQALFQTVPGSIPPPDIETLDPREAKRLLQQWIGNQQAKTDVQVRLSLANLLSLETLESRCPSFARFTLDLSAALPP